MNEIADYLRTDLATVVLTAISFAVGTEALQHGMQLDQWAIGPVEVATALMVGITMMIGTRIGQRMRRPSR